VLQSKRIIVGDEINGSLSVDQAKRLKEVEKENTRLKKLVAELSLDKSILKEVAEGKY